MVLATIAASLRPRLGRPLPRIALVAAIGLTSASACMPAPTPPMPGAPVPYSSASDLMAHLEDGGLAFRPIGESRYQWFEAPALTYEMGEGMRDVLFVHQHEGVAAAQAAARRVSPDGQRIVGPEGNEILVQWLGEPHLFQSGSLVVVYVGTDTTVIARLEDELGPQFAGSEAPQG